MATAVARPKGAIQSRSFVRICRGLVRMPASSWTTCRAHTPGFESKHSSCCDCVCACNASGIAAATNRTTPRKDIRLSYPALYEAGLKARSVTAYYEGAYGLEE